MKINASEISSILQQQIKDYEQKVNITEEGTVLSVGDGIALVYGLKNAMAGELLNFPDADNVKGMVLKHKRFGIDPQAHCHSCDG